MVCIVRGNNAIEIALCLKVVKRLNLNRDEPKFQSLIKYDVPIQIINAQSNLHCPLVHVLKMM